MFLHLGEDTVVPIKNVIAILEYNPSDMSQDTKEFLSISREEGFMKIINDNEVKSFIITENKKRTTIYLSPISSITLLKRAGFLDNKH